MLLGTTPLSAALHLGLLDIAEFLVKSGARLDVVNEFGDGLLHELVKADKVKVRVKVRVRVRVRVKVRVKVKVRVRVRG